MNCLIRMGEYNNELENGDFYATTGPKIKELYCENGEIHIKTSPVHSIRFLSEGRDGLIVTAPAGETVCEAVFPIEPDFLGKTARVDLRDDDGNFAHSRPYRIDEML